MHYSRPCCSKRHWQEHQRKPSVHSRRRLAKSFEDTWKHTAKFDGLPKEATEYFKAKVQKFIDLTGSGWDFEIIEEKIEGDCAVVVINESKKEGKKAFDLDPAFLIKQDGEWRVLPDVTDWKIVKKVAKDKAASFEKLVVWFDKRSDQLKMKEED